MAPRGSISATASENQKWNRGHAGAFNRRRCTNCQRSIMIPLLSVVLSSFPGRARREVMRRVISIRRAVWGKSSIAALAAVSALPATRRWWWIWSQANSSHTAGAKWVAECGFPDDCDFFSAKRCRPACSTRRPNSFRSGATVPRNLWVNAGRLRVAELAAQAGITLQDQNCVKFSTDLFLWQFTSGSISITRTELQFLTPLGLIAGRPLPVRSDCGSLLARRSNGLLKELEDFGEEHNEDREVG